MPEPTHQDPAAANAAARAAGKEAGTGPADSIIMGCDLLRIGVFFDGTGNSREHIHLPDISWHTNVDLLQRRYADTKGTTIKEINGNPRKVNYFSRYMRGIGVEEDGGTTMRGMGWGTGAEGVENRVRQAMDFILQDIQIKASGMQPCDIWFDTFGFSRGSVAARDFANGVMDKEITYGSSRLKVKFMGLFDTVSSVGNAGNIGSYENVMISTVGNVAETIAHITAKDEVRENFPLALAVKGTRIEVVGAHSDIGGGYDPGILRDTFSFDSADYPRMLSFYETRWGVQDRNFKPGDDDRVTSFINKNLFTEDSRTVVLHTTAEQGIQFVTLRLMYDQAIAAGVPFPETMPDDFGGVNVTLADNLQAYYDELKDYPHSAKPETELAIRRQYAHLSVNNDSAWGIIDYNLPERDAVRRVATI